MIHPWNRAKSEAVLLQRRYTCEVCGIARATEAHHAIVKRDKNCRAVDNICNVQMVCHKCHMEGKADTKENKERAMRQAITRHGAPYILAWLNELKELGKQVDEQMRLVSTLEKEA